MVRQSIDFGAEDPELSRALASREARIASGQQSAGDHRIASEAPGEGWPAQGAAAASPASTAAFSRQAEKTPSSGGASDEPDLTASTFAGGFFQRGDEWLKFLVYAEMFAYVAWNAYRIFEAFGSLRYAMMGIVNVPVVVRCVVSICLLAALAVFALFVRDCLAKRKSDAPKWLLALLIADFVYTIGLYLASCLIYGGFYVSTFTIVYGVVSIAHFYANWLYFESRKELFAG